MQENQSSRPNRTRRSQRYDAPEGAAPKYERPWQQNQSEEWTDHIRVVRDEDLEDEVTPEVHRPAERLASNLTIRLAGTIAAMFSPFALFLLFAERSSRALRHYALQSVALTALNLGFGLLVLLIGTLLGAVPLLGYVTRLACWLVYLGAAAALLVLRVRLMLFAWHGYRWDVPVVGRILQRWV